MKNLLYTLLIALLLAACSTSSSPDQQKNLVKTKIGAWTSVYNKDNPKDSHLNWDGRSTFSKSSTSTISADSSKWGYYDAEGMWHADTVVYNNTSQHVSMTAKMLNYDGYGDFIPVLVYRDSTMTESVINNIPPFTYVRGLSGTSNDFKKAPTGDKDNTNYTLFRLPYTACSDTLRLTDGSDYITIGLSRDDIENLPPPPHRRFYATYIKIYVGQKANQAIQDMCANVVK